MLNTERLKRRTKTKRKTTKQKRTVAIILLGYFIGIDSGGVPRFLCSSVAQQCAAPMRIIGSGVLGRTP